MYPTRNILGDAKKEAIKAAWEKVRAERKEERKAERQAALLNAPKVTHIYITGRRPEVNALYQ